MSDEQTTSTPLDMAMLDVLLFAWAMADVTSPLMPKKQTAADTLPIFGVPKDLAARFENDPASASISLRHRVASYLEILADIAELIPEPAVGELAKRTRGMVDRVMAAHRAEAELRFAHVTPADLRERTISIHLAALFAMSPPPPEPAGFTWDDP